MERQASRIMRRFAALLTAVTILLFSFINSSAQEWDYFKIPGGVHHKTVFVDHEDIQGMFSVCMSDKLCFRKWVSGDWDTEWDTYAFPSTWGLDYAAISDGGAGTDAWILVGGKGKLEAYKYVSTDWIQQTISTPSWANYEPGFQSHDCVFYGDELDPDNVLVCRTFDDENENGLYYWYNNSYWREIEGSAGYGMRMWRSWTHGDTILITQQDNNNIYFIDVDDFPTFSPTAWFAPNGVTVQAVQAFNRWKDGDDIYHYAAAVTTLSGTTTYDIWVRKYTGSSSQWGDWSKEVSDLSDTWLPAWDDGLATGDYYPCFVAGRPYTSGANTYHRVYLSTDQYGMVMFDTGDLTNTPITVNEGSNSSFSHNWHPRWLEINPLESDEDIDDLILSTFKSAIEEGKMDYTNDPFITWDTEFYGWSTTEGGTDLSGGIVREPYVDVNEQKIFLPCEFSGIFSIPLDGYTGGEPYSRNLGTTNTNWYEDANFGNVP